MCYAYFIDHIYYFHFDSSMRGKFKILEKNWLEKCLVYHLYCTNCDATLLELLSIAITTE